MFPFTRSSEHTKPQGNYSVGLLVRTADGKRYFFPGSEPDDGMILARISLSEAQLDHQDTLIEYGVRTENEWVPSKTVKASAATPVET